MKFLKIFYFI